MPRIQIARLSQVAPGATCAVRRTCGMVVSVCERARLAASRHISRDCKGARRTDVVPEQMCWLALKALVSSKTRCDAMTQHKADHANVYFGEAPSREIASLLVSHPFICLSSIRARSYLGTRLGH